MLHAYAKLKDSEKEFFCRKYDLDMLKMEFVLQLRSNFLARLNLIKHRDVDEYRETSFDDFYTRVSKSILVGFNQNVCIFYFILLINIQYKK